MKSPGSDHLIRIVVVDDQMLVREGLRRVIDAVADLELVGECSDGDEVVDRVRTTRPDVVLMDMRMKRTDGATAIKELSQLEDHPPVLVLTTYDDPETLAAALQAGANGFLLKESVALDLVRAVRTVAEGGAWIDPAVASIVLDAYRGFQPPAETTSTARVESLTEREREVLRLIAHGWTNSEIAAELFISERTVKTHIGHLFTKLDVRDRVAAVLLAYESGIVQRPNR